MKSKKSLKDLSFMLGIGGTAKSVGQLGGMGILTLTGMKKVSKVGSVVAEENLVGGTASVYFLNVKAVSALIDELVTMRSNMVSANRSWKKLEIKVNASNRKPTRHSDKRRKPSRAGAKR